MSSDVEDWVRVSLVHRTISDSSLWQKNNFLTLERLEDSSTKSSFTQKVSPRTISDRYVSRFGSTSDEEQREKPKNRARELFNYAARKPVVWWESRLQFLHFKYQNSASCRRPSFRAALARKHFSNSLFETENLAQRKESLASISERSARLGSRGFHERQFLWQERSSNECQAAVSAVQWRRTLGLWDNDWHVGSQ